MAHREGVGWGGAGVGAGRTGSCATSGSADRPARTHARTSLPGRKGRPRVERARPTGRACAVLRRSGAPLGPLAPGEECACAAAGLCASAPPPEVRAAGPAGPCSPAPAPAGSVSTRPPASGRSPLHPGRFPDAASGAPGTRLCKSLAGRRPPPAPAPRPPARPRPNLGRSCGAAGAAPTAARGPRGPASSALPAAPPSAVRSGPALLQVAGPGGGQGRAGPAGPGGQGREGRAGPEKAGQGSWGPAVREVRDGSSAGLRGCPGPAPLSFTQAARGPPGRSGLWGFILGSGVCPSALISVYASPLVPEEFWGAGEPTKSALKRSWGVTWHEGEPASEGFASGWD